LINTLLWIGISLIPIRIRILDADADPNWYRNDTDPHADPTRIFTHVGQLFGSVTVIHNVCVKVVMIFSNLDSIWKFSEKNKKIRVLELRIYTDPDPNPAK
jgi:hypothetical protein